MVPTLRRSAERVGALRSDHVAKNGVAIMATTVANGALGYCFWGIAARAFPASEVGAVAAVISAGFLAATLSDLGLRTTLMQQLPRNRNPIQWSKSVSSAVLAGALAAVLSGTIAWAVVVRLSPTTRDTLHGAWPAFLIMFTVAQTISTMLDGVSTAERRAAQILHRNLLVAVVKICALALFVAVVPGVSQSILMATSIALATGALYGLKRQLAVLMPEWRFGTGRVRESRQAVGGIWHRHYALNLGGFLPGFILPLEVVARESARENAYFTFTWMVATLFFMVSSSISSALFVQGRWDPEKLRETTRRAAKLIVLVLIPLGVVVALLGRHILGLFGEDYATEGYPLLLVLALAAIPDAITNLRIAYLRASGHLAQGAMLNLGMATLCIALAWVLLPHLGIVGAGLAWLAAQSSGAALTLLFLGYKRSRRRVSV